MTAANVVCANAREAEALSGPSVGNRADAERAAAGILRRGAPHTAIEAPDGKVLGTPTGMIWLENLPVEAIDTTGAGDAFAGALALRRPSPMITKFGRC